MNILVNTRLLLKDRMEGIGWFTYNLLKEMVSQHPEHQFYFLFDRPFDNRFVFARNVVPIVAGPPARHPFLYWIWFELTVPRIIKKYNIDVFFSTDHFLSLRAKIPTILVVHDLNFLHQPENLPFLTSVYYRLFFPKYVKKASSIVAVSNYTRNDLLTFYPYLKDKIQVVYNAPNLPAKQLKEEEKETIRKKYCNGRPFFFYIGSLHQRKNIANMLKAFDNFVDETGEDVYLIIGGKAMWSDRYTEKVYKSIKHKEKIIFTGRLDDDEASSLIAASLAMLYVSLFEGFGVPLIEAMQNNVPVITSNCTAMPEVAGTAACYVTPTSVDDIKEGIKKVYYNDEYRNQLIENGKEELKRFSWQKSARDCWTVFNNYLK